MTNTSKQHTPGPYSMNFNAVGKTYRIIGADGYGAIAEVFTESNAAMLAQGLNERDALLSECKRQREELAQSNPATVTIQQWRDEAAKVPALSGEVEVWKQGHAILRGTVESQREQIQALREVVQLGLDTLVPAWADCNPREKRFSDDARAALKVSP